MTAATLTGKPCSPRRRTPSRPYAKDKSVPSITTVLQALSKPAMVWASARETAMFAVNRPEEWEGLAPREAINRLAAHHDVLWGGAKAMGTLIHSVNEAWVWGEEADLERLVGEAANPPKRGNYQPVGVKAWKGREDLVIADAAGYVDGLERFWLDFKPETLATEEVVRHMRSNRPFYQGQRDWVAVIDDQTTNVEIKTSSKVADPDKPGDRLWLDSWRLQLAAQTHASHIVDYDAEGNEEGIRPNYPVRRSAVLHLCGDGDYGFWEVRAAGDEHGTFLRLVDVWRWWHAGHKEPPAIDLKPLLAAKEEAAA